MSEHEEERDDNIVATEWPSNLSWLDLSRDVVTIEAPQISPELRDNVTLVGMLRPLRILYKPFAGNALYFYDQNLKLLLDLYALYHAESVIFTNQERKPGESLRGKVLFEAQVTLFGQPSVRNYLRLRRNDQDYMFRDEWSFYECNNRFLNMSPTSTIEAYIH